MPKKRNSPGAAPHQETLLARGYIRLVGGKKDSGMWS